jgi:hypothetical protein
MFEELSVGSDQRVIGGAKEMSVAIRRNNKERGGNNSLQ